MRESDVIVEIKKRIESAGSMRALAKEWDVTPSYICDLVNGRRAPGPKILGPLGLKIVETEIEYVKVAWGEAK